MAILESDGCDDFWFGVWLLLFVFYFGSWYVRVVCLVDWFFVDFGIGVVVSRCGF